MSTPHTSPANKIQGQLLALAGLFLAFYTLANSLAPLVRSRAWSSAPSLFAALPWMPWLNLAICLGLSYCAHRLMHRYLPDGDAYLLPVAVLLSGWGLQTITRLIPSFGLRQAAWLLVSGGIFLLGLKTEQLLRLLRRYKYVWLTSGLILTGLTLIFGVNPGGYGARLWLGCCGFYLQPSEPLKLLLVIYLAAYLSDHRFWLSAAPRQIDPIRRPAFFLSLLSPTLAMTGLALLLLIFQRDLGTVSVFFFLYTIIIYMASGFRQILWFGAAGISVAGLAGYALFDVVRLRVDAWLNPWLDPSGRSYQIVQSLLAIANGGIFGRGPGMGNPGLVPVAHSDFIFTAIAEETGLIGTLALTALLVLIVNRGLRAAIYASDTFCRLLAAGLTAHLVGQSILIIGGNLRLLPLTGVTLPFVSYGGSSLVTSFVSLLLLLKISAQDQNKAAPLVNSQAYKWTALLLNAGLVALAVVNGWWAIYRGPDLLTRTDNARRAIADRYVRRGSILDRQYTPLADTVGQPGSYTRVTRAVDLSPVLGYIHPVYGQSGLEASLDPYLRGVVGNPPLRIWWSHILYGQPPPGLDVHLSLDLSLQQSADRLLGDHPSALVLVDAKSGEILALASHPSFDPNRLGDEWAALLADPESPLLNRAVQNLYPTGATLAPLLLASVYEKGLPTDIPADLSYPAGGLTLECALPVAAPEKKSWGATLSAGCPGVTAQLGRELGQARLLALYQMLGLFEAPQLYLPTAYSDIPENGDGERLSLGLRRSSLPTAEWIEPAFWVNPMQIALAAALLSNGGVRPAPHLLLGIAIPGQDWQIIPSLEKSRQALDPQACNDAAYTLAATRLPIWQSAATAVIGSAEANEVYSWYVGGTLPSWQGSPLALAVLIEGDYPQLAAEIGEAMLATALQPNQSSAFPHYWRK